MYLKVVTKIFLMILLLIFQVAFISGLPSVFSNINLVLVVLILVLGFSNYRSSLIWAMGIGLLLDMYFFTFFGINTIALLIALVSTNFLLENTFTNRSLYTYLALTAFASLLHEVSIVLLNLLYTFLFSINIPYDFSGMFWMDELYKIVANLALVFILFYMLSFFSKRFRPMFLIR